MPTFKKKDLNELIGGDISAGGNDRNPTNNSEIETGPVQKPHNDTSDYEKGQATTTDRVVSRYRQNIPWFAVYSYGGSRANGAIVRENESSGVIVKKKTVEEKIEDLVKKSKSSDVTQKDYDPKISKLVDTINDTNLTPKQLEDLEKAIQDKKNNSETTKML